MIKVANKNLRFAIEKYTSNDEIRDAVDAVQIEVNIGSTTGPGVVQLCVARHRNVINVRQASCDMSLASEDQFTVMVRNQWRSSL